MEIGRLYRSLCTHHRFSTRKGEFVEIKQEELATVIEAGTGRCIMRHHGTGSAFFVENSEFNELFEPATHQNDIAKEIVGSLDSLSSEDLTEVQELIKSKQSPNYLLEKRIKELEGRLDKQVEVSKEFLALTKEMREDYDNKIKALKVKIYKYERGLY